MHIHKAIKRALRRGKCIYRSKSERRYVKYKPTHSRDCIFIVYQHSWEPERPAQPRWNPTAEDLMADDWELI